MKLIINNTGTSNVDRFWELFYSFDFIKKDQYRIIAFKDDKWLWDYNIKFGELWLSRKNFWVVLETEFGLSYKDIQLFIKYTVEEHFKNKNVTPILGL